AHPAVMGALSCLDHLRLAASHELALVRGGRSGRAFGGGTAPVRGQRRDAEIETPRGKQTLVPRDENVQTHERHHALDGQRHRHGRRPLLGSKVRRADPARLGDVDGDAVGAAVLHLDVAVALCAAGVAAHAERLVDVVAARRVRGGEPLGGVVEIVDLEAEVMDAGPVLAPLDAGHLVVLELEDGEVDLAVGQVVAAGVRIVDAADLLQSEHVDVELRGRVGILRGQRDVPDLRHGGRLVIYASTPISPRGGGGEKVNVEIAASVKARLAKAYGGGGWVLDPGVYQLPSVDGRAPGGGDYMVMWTRVLAGDDGAGRDVD